jgi:hypothetical protein
MDFTYIIRYLSEIDIAALDREIAKARDYTPADAIEIVLALPEAWRQYADTLQIIRDAVVASHNYPYGDRGRRRRR